MSVPDPKPAAPAKRVSPKPSAEAAEPEPASMAAPAPTAPPVPSAPPPERWHPPHADHARKAVIALLVLGAILAILYAWRLPPFAGSVEETDNAYVRGRTTIISPEVSGYVVQVPVADFQQVRAGQVLVRIEDRIYGARVEQARASLSAQVAGYDNSAQAQRSREANEKGQQAAIVNADAQLLRARADMQRVDGLVADGSVSKRERDQVLAALRQAEAQVRQAHAGREIAAQDTRSVIVGRGGLSAGVEGARAQLHLTQIDLDHTVIRAPEAGQLSEIGVRNGQFVTAGTQLMFLVPRQMWIIANFKEAQTRRMRIGQAATFKIDALGGERLTGHVESIAPAAGSEFAVLKPDNATGNFVKVAQRIAVRFAIDPGQALAARLRPGMSVMTRVETRGGQ
jgi:multidrug resistance efflux pump